MQSEHAIIVKKVKRKNKGNKKGGAWEVAMADLMISMMCFFLVMWILQVINTEDKEKFINFMKDGNLELVEHGNGLGNSISPIHLPQVATSRSEDYKEFVMEDSSVIEGEFNTQQELTALANFIDSQLDNLDPNDSISLEVTPQGLKLVISDSNKGSMFDRGGSRITPYYQDLLIHLAPLIYSIKNSMVITGHTDSVKFVGRKQSNWDLSSQRANVARDTLVESGFPTSHIFQVTGMADTAPLNPDDTRSSVNRRVELFILTRSAKEIMSTIYKNNRLDQRGDYVKNFNESKKKAANEAENNQWQSSFEAVN
ncbi:OmpA family protein [Vibrio casei]|uniref:Histidine kinase n=2 Tax=Vibrio casei TaxID=673372 RepID=A0A368LK86_9VIBR|nr:OmpA family protein [Vibrio casei]RCS70763.1 histidine kinase [Vibrio casei]SJN25277.1 Flagellar motor rotation protein MotB [Vibrio casei]